MKKLYYHFPNLKMIDKFFYMMFGGLDRMCAAIAKTMGTQPRKKMRDTKVIEKFLQEQYKKVREMALFRNLKKEVETGPMELKTTLLKKVPIKNKIAKK